MYRRPGPVSRGAGPPTHGGGGLGILYTAGGAPYARGRGILHSAQNRSPPSRQRGAVTALAPQVPRGVGCESRRPDGPAVRAGRSVGILTVNLIWLEGPPGPRGRESLLP